MLRRRTLSFAGLAPLLLAATLGAEPLPPAFHAKAGAGAAFAASRWRGTPGAGTVYASNFYPSSVEVYAAGQLGAPLVGTIYNGVSGAYNLAVDTSGTLYVDNNDCTVTEFARGAFTPMKILTVPCAQGTGAGVTVGPNGTVFVSDPYDSQVFAFAHGSTTATSTFFLSAPYGLAVDAHNDLFVTYGSPGRIEEFPGGKAPGKDIGISIAETGGLAFDTAGNLLVGDQRANVIDVFKSGSTSPFRQLVTSPVDPYTFAFGRTGKTLFVGGGTPPGVYAYDYATGKPLGTISAGYSAQDYTLGVAVDPRQPY